MSELDPQEPLPSLTKKEIFERMSDWRLFSHIQGLGEKATKIEQEMDLAARVFESEFGITIEEYMQQQELSPTAPEGTQ